MTSEDLICPKCGRKMILQTSPFLTYGNGEPRKYWSCEFYPLCDVQHSAHPDGRPVGFPADKKTRIARVDAHEAFDALWRDLGLTRTQGYELLQQITGLSEEDAHIGRFTLDQCAALVEAIIAYRLHRRADAPDRRDDAG
jgi:hypothetical protein